MRFYNISLYETKQILKYSVVGIFTGIEFKFGYRRVPWNKLRKDSRVFIIVWS